MTEPKIRLMFLWHMHQPYYKDLVSGVYRLPWTRLHGLKDYYGMVAILEEFPRIHQTFNLVPSLLLQIEEYASGNARELVQDLAYQPTAQLTRDNRLFILQYFFQANVDRLISRYSRYRELYDRIHASGFLPERALPFFSDKDFADLQVLSQLAWFDEFFLDRDPELRALVSKGQGYGYEDQQTLQRKQRELLGEVLKAYRAAADRGQIEISTSPFYHPILPLLCDSNVAGEAHPGVRLPPRRFRHPEDARLQLERAIDLHRRCLGRTPSGLWPSEGSVSAEVLEICASLGFRWMASDQQVLSNSIGVPFYRDRGGALVNADQLYAPHGYSTPSGEIQMLFRDHELSDLIGFVYSRMQAEDAASDFVGRLKQSAQALTAQGKSPIVPVILDGENAWEYYPENGRPFLRALYTMLSGDPTVECVTVTEALDLHGPSTALPRLAAGSWINANFDIWIGAEEDNQAWTLLSEARDCFSERQHEATLQNRELALEELLVAEGSDWCWWYGPEHSTVNDADFDALYRCHLANVYHALGQRPPDILAQPIAAHRGRAISDPPAGPISPRIDGLVTTYFEWLGAGFYSPIRSGAAMHGGSCLMRELRFGRDSGNFFLRIDFQDRPPEALSRIKFRIAFRKAVSRAVQLSFSRPDAGAPIACELWREDHKGTLPASLGQAALDKILEVRLSLEAIGAGASDDFEFQIALWEDDYPRETLPLEDWLAAPAPTPTDW